jgi:Tfp pilus assembly protein PilN
MTNLVLREEINRQNQMITMARPLRNSDQLISKHQRIQKLINTIEPQADKLAEIDRMVTSEVLVKSIDISGKRIIISGRCWEYDQLATMIERIDQAGALAIIKSECIQSPSETGFDFVVEAEWIKI